MDGTTAEVAVLAQAMVDTALAAQAAADAARDMDADEAARALAGTHVVVDGQDEVAAMVTETTTEVDASAVERELDVLEEEAAQDGGIPGAVSIAAKIAQVKAERAARGAVAEGESFGEATVKAATAQLAGEMAAGAAMAHTTVVVGSDGKPVATHFTPAPKPGASKPGRKPQAAPEPLTDAEVSECERLQELGERRTPEQARRYRALVERMKVVNIARAQGRKGKTNGKAAPATPATPAAPVVDAAAVALQRHVEEENEKARQAAADALAQETDKLLAAQKEHDDAARKRTEEAAEALTKIDAQRALLSVQHRDALSKALEMIDVEIAQGKVSLGTLDALRARYAPPAPVVIVTTKKGAGTGTGGRGRGAGRGGWSPRGDDGAGQSLRRAGRAGVEPAGHARL